MLELPEVEDKVTCWEITPKFPFSLLFKEGLRENFREVLPLWQYISTAVESISSLKGTQRVLNICPLLGAQELDSDEPSRCVHHPGRL